MEKKRRPRTDVKALICAVLDILQERTDEDHPLSAKEIRDILARSYELEPDRDTLTEVLGALRQRYPGPGRVRSRGTEKAGGATYTHGHYLERDFSAQEVEMLLNDVMFSRMRPPRQAAELVKKLKGLVSARQRKALAYADFLPFSLYTASALVQKNIALVQQVISDNLHSRRKERVIGFSFNGYGTDHRLHKVPNGTYRDFLPLKILEAYGSYYVMGLMDGRSEPWNFRLDLMTDLVSRERDRTRDDARERTIRMAGSATALSDYLTQHLYMAYEGKGEGVETVYLQVEKVFRESARGERIYYKPLSSMTILHDAFGRNYQVLFENERYADVRVEGVLWGIATFVRQHMDRVRVTGPGPAKEKVEAMLKADYAAYFQRPYGA